MQEEGHKKVRMPYGVRTFRIQESCNCPLSLYHGELLSAEIRQVFWLANHPPGAFPTIVVSGVYALRHRLQRRVRGGIASS